MVAQCASDSRLHVKNPLCLQPMANQPLDPSMSIATTHDHNVAKKHDKFEHRSAVLKLSFKDAAVEGEFLLYRHANRWMPVVGISCILIGSIIAFFAVGKQRSFVESLFVFVPCIVWLCGIIIMVAMKFQLSSMPPVALIKYNGYAGAQPEDALLNIANAPSAEAIRNAWIHEIGVLLCVVGLIPMLLWTYWMKGHCHNISEEFDRHNLCVHGFYWDGITLMYYPMCFVLFPTSTAKYAALFSIFLGLYFGLRFLPDYSVEVLYSHLFSDALLNGGAAIGSIIAAFFSERHLRTKFVEVSTVHLMSLDASELRRETLRLRTAQFPGEVVDTARFHEHELRWYSHGGAVCVMGIHHFYDWASVRGPLDAALLLQQFIAAADFICASVALELKQNHQATTRHRLCRGQVLGDEFVTYCGPLMHAGLNPYGDCPCALATMIESVQGLLLLTSRFQKVVTELSLFAGVGYNSNPALCPPEHVEGKGQKHMLSLICGISEGTCVAIMSAETSGLVFVGPAVRDACSCLHRRKQIAMNPDYPQLIVATNERLGTMLQCHNAARLETESLLIAKVALPTPHAPRTALREEGQANDDDALDGHNITEAQSMQPSDNDSAEPSLAPLLIGEARTTEIQVVMLTNSTCDHEREEQHDGMPMTVFYDDVDGTSSSEVSSHLADRSPTNDVDFNNGNNLEANKSHSTVPLSHNMLASNVASMTHLIGVIPCMAQSLWLGAVFESDATERTYSEFRDAEYGGTRRSIVSFSCLSAFSLACVAICSVDENHLSMWFFLTSSLSSVAGALLAFLESSLSCLPRVQWVASTLIAAYVVVFVAGVFVAPRGSEVGNSRIPWVFVVCLLQLRPVVSRPLVMWVPELAVCVTFATEAFFYPNATDVGLNVAPYVVVYLSLAVAFLQMRVQSDLTVRKEFVIGARIKFLSDALLQYHDMLASAVAEVAPEGVAAELRNRLRAKAASKVITGEINFLPFRSTQLTTTADDVELLVIRVSFPRWHACPSTQSLKDNHHRHSLCDEVKMTFECNDHIEALIYGLMHSEPLCKSIDRCKLVPGDVMAFTSRSGDFGDCEERAANLFLAAPLILNALECASLPGGPLPVHPCHDEAFLMKVVAYRAIFVSGPVVGTLVGSSGASFEYCGAAPQLALHYVRFVVPENCCFATSRFLMRCRTGLEHKVRTDPERSAAILTDSADGLSEELVTHGGCVLASVAKASNPFKLRGGQRVFLHAIALPRKGRNN